MKPITFILFVLITLLLFSCGFNESEPGKQAMEIRVLHAGSLSIPFKDMAQTFMKKYPQYKVLLEGHGSRSCARQITDLKRRVDVMGSADSAVIRNLLMPEYADFCIDFTTNEMVIMYTGKSKFADTINADNWYEILLKPDVQYGHSDPNADPCGYRSVLTWQLAETYYKVENLFKKLSEKMPEKNIRSKEVDLIALLETGELDYIFIYRSVAEQHQAKYVILPDEINLKSAEHAEFYKTASLKITGKKPGEWIEKKGAPMVYGITMPKNAPNPEGGIKFISFVLGKEGQEIMKKNGQPEIVPPRVDNKDKLPEALKKFFYEI
ncbi:MAG: tungstate ABC transporter substrate-binding protein WtpA [Candidatus Aminicenantes bacterium]|nr:tungstate ABC transporter substrate-binding protein WtpA [Candidatus Aminicenantes bacterium]NIM80420.1 tungstate ABC transporter substrate-binding protein WtpA [Candidatus Aminicenantes bacterium]NIN17768.1 tungstate ABC transporter substrate-binding protein WtpA [Candidatus Aminicenantes bacterium]NIN43689.1 tungstate ABC transporter substrate-binding protein WtpA [Candidatus Aminicenantes bacterium]NIN86434.1 tungstate ABC transporter substrate-binding protein WtpA [Candidatus Aminicenant